MKLIPRGKISDEVRVRALRMVDVVAAVYGLRGEDLFKRTRSLDVVEARWIAMFALRDQVRMNCRQVAEFFGKDHGTVLYACRQVRVCYEVDRKFRERWQRMAPLVLDVHREFADGMSAV